MAIKTKVLVLYCYYIWTKKNEKFADFVAFKSNSEEAVLHQG